MILITGATGFIGRPITKKLIDEGQNVRVFTRDGRRAKALFPKADIFVGDITSKDSVIRSMKGVTKVIHLAGLVDYKDKDKLLLVNYQGTKNVVDSSKNIDKLVYSSSVTVFGNTLKKVNENSRRQPDTHYGKSKVMAEDLISHSNVDAAMLRIAPVYGEGSPWFNYFLSILSLGLPCPQAENKIQFIHVSDVTQAISLALNKGRGPFIIAEQKAVRMDYVAEKLATFVGRKYRTVPIWAIETVAKLTGKKVLLDILLENMLFDTTKARKELGFRPKANMNVELKKMADAYLSTK